MSIIRMQAGDRCLEIEGAHDVMLVIAHALNVGDITCWSLRPVHDCDDKLTRKVYRPSAPDWYHNLTETFEEFSVEGVKDE